jgi:hypothetical protein
MSNGNNPFAAPAAAEGIKWAELSGRLLVIEPKSVEAGIATAFGETSAVRADVHVIDGPAPTTYDDVLVFPKVLQSQIKGSVGRQVLGRLGQGVAKPGQSAPWRIEDPTPKDVELGTKWLAQRNSNAFAAAGSTGDADTPPF